MYNATFDNFDLKSSVVGYILNNNYQKQKMMKSDIGSTYSQKTFKIKKTRFFEIAKILMSLCDP